MTNQREKGGTAGRPSRRPSRQYSYVNLPSVEAEFAAVLAEAGYTTKSEAIRDLMRQCIARVRGQQAGNS